MPTSQVMFGALIAQRQAPSHGGISLSSALIRGGAYRNDERYNDLSDIDWDVKVLTGIHVV